LTLNIIGVIFVTSSAKANTKMMCKRELDMNNTESQNIDFKADYIRYLERKCCELMIARGVSMEYIQEQTREMLDVKSSMSLNNG